MNLIIKHTWKPNRELVQCDTSIKRIVRCLAGWDLQETSDFSLYMRIILM